MHLREASFVIRQENKKGALSAIKNLWGKETIADSSGRHFSWVSTADFIKAETLEEAMLAWRWKVEGCPFTGDTVNIDFIGEKLGDDELLFTQIAEYVEDGSYIEMQGEDGDIWRWSFKDGELREQSATLVWE